jgi:6-pyruvoyltetrahydropterin/6-carboxytetrahydropterin synthase|tara:strand:+ start:1541 stop:1930 length:390 start_codon:yes stop_codon:yes gene_type:complete
MRTSVTKLFEFEACHHLPNYDGACRNLHGHSYKLEVEIKGEIDDVSGMVTDFSELKKTVKRLVINKYDHADLNEFFDMPTAENMVVEIFRVLDEYFNYNELDGVPLTIDHPLERVRLYETSTSYAEVKR